MGHILLKSRVAFCIKYWSKWYYKIGKVLQSWVVLLQSQTGIIKRCDFYNRVGHVLQSWAIITKLGSTNNVLEGFFLIFPSFPKRNKFILVFSHKYQKDFHYSKIFATRILAFLKILKSKTFKHS